MKSVNSKLKIGVVGAGGRIGKELLNLILQSNDLEATLGVGNKAKGFLENAYEYRDVKDRNIDVLIDFSSPSFFIETLDFCKKNKISLVSGTTGLKPEHHEEMRIVSREIPVLWAPNMSLGIAILKKSLSVFKSAINFDFQIEEWHHKNKKDSPSGTAIYLKSELESVIEKTCPPTLVMRAGGIFGVHKVYAVSEEEQITFEHAALNRTVFARGALVGARWISKNRKNGVYSMDDVIS